MKMKRYEAGQARAYYAVIRHRRSARRLILHTIFAKRLTYLRSARKRRVEGGIRSEAGSSYT